MKNKSLSVTIIIYLICVIGFGTMAQEKHESIEISPDVTYQTIEGFGFFGAHDVWWGDHENLWNREWAEMVITDLGISMWRNEIYPPSTPERRQDADWNKQLPVVEGFKSVADEHGVDLRYILTVWSPPAHMKWDARMGWAGDRDATRVPSEHVQTNRGGTLNPEMYREYAEYLITEVQSYVDKGIDVYALSLQNEPAFSQSFNSCQYTTYWYTELLNGVVPFIRKAFPRLLIFGSEHMLQNEGRDVDWPHFYHNEIKNDPHAPDNIDVFAVHGYTDGVSASHGSALVDYWTNHKEQFSGPLGKRAWMTETSGYSDEWLGDDKDPGALALASDIQAGLLYGDMSAWVWWQGSESGGIGRYNLMKGVIPGKKYYASKHFYRFIRPGAVRIDVTANDPDMVISGFKHQSNETVTIVIVNPADEGKSVLLSGNGLQGEFSVYLTTSGDFNCTLRGSVIVGSALDIPPQSVVTLQSGGKPL